MKYIFILYLFLVVTNVQAQKMVLVKGGNYTTSTGQDVLIKDFYIDVNEVTIQNFSEFVRKTNYITQAEKQGYATITGGEKKSKVCWKYDINGNLIPEKDWQLYPVVFLTSDDIMAYCKWAKKRLPTEAEWEYAFREGRNSNYKYSGSNSVKKVAWSDEKDGISGMQPVRTKKPNALGIYDMSGNTNELCTTIKGDFFVWKGGGLVDDISRFTYQSRKEIKTLDAPFWYIGFRTVKEVRNDD